MSLFICKKKNRCFKPDLVIVMDFDITIFINTELLSQIMFLDPEMSMGNLYPDKMSRKIVTKIERKQFKNIPT